MHLHRHRQHHNPDGPQCLLGGTLQFDGAMRAPQVGVVRVGTEADITLNRGALAAARSGTYRVFRVL